MLKFTLKTLATLALLILTFVSGVTMAQPAIPKRNLLECEVPKELVKTWFINFWISERDTSRFNSLAPNISFILKQDLIAGTNVSNFYQLSIKGKDSNGVVRFQKELEQLAVNFDENTISVGYAPYDVTRAGADPFSMILQTAPGQRTGQARLAIVPFQTPIPAPFRTIEFPCTRLEDPREATSLDLAELNALSPAQQHEILYHLSRRPLNGLYAYVEDRPRADRIIVPSSVVANIKASVSVALAARAVPPLLRPREGATMKVATGDRCGQVRFYDQRAIYDTPTAKALRLDPTNAALKAKVLGYRISGLSCANAARTVTTPRTNGNGAPYVSNDSWSVQNLVVDVNGSLITGSSLEKASVSLQ